MPIRIDACPSPIIFIIILHYYPLTIAYNCNYTNHTHSTQHNILYSTHNSLNVGMYNNSHMNGHMGNVSYFPPMYYMAASDHAILSNLGGFELNNLISILDIEDDEPQIIQHSSYYDIDSLKKLISKHNNIFSVLSLNIQSINAKFSELETLVEELHNVQFKFNVICLQECWISDQTDACIFQIPGYDCVAQGKSSSERGGLITYVDHLFEFEVRQSINEYELWEGQIIQVKGGCLRKEIIVGNIYRPPGTLRELTKQGSTLAVFRYPENPRFPDGIPDSPEQ